MPGLYFEESKPGAVIGGFWSATGTIRSCDAAIAARHIGSAQAWHCRRRWEAIVSSRRA
jgi:hypothetical protein